MFGLGLIGTVLKPLAVSAGKAVVKKGIEAFESKATAPVAKNDFEAFLIDAAKLAQKIKQYRDSDHDGESDFTPAEVTELMGDLLKLVAKHLP
jgi:hypothetical protein